MAVHEDVATTADTGLIRVRARTQTACRNCARMKAKCDANSPCDRCRLRQLRCERRPRKPHDETWGTTGNEHASGGTDIGSHDLGVNGVEMGSSDDIDDAISDEHTAHDAQRLSTNIPSPPVQAEASVRPTNPLAQRAIFEDSMSMDVTTTGYTSSVAIDGVQRPLLSHNASDAPGTHIMSILSPMPRWHEPELDTAAFVHDYNENDGNNPVGSILNDPSPQLRTQQQNTGSNLVSMSDQEPGYVQGQWELLSPLMEEAPDHPAIIEAQNYWSAFACNPRPNILTCPRTAGDLLENLGHMPESEKLWELIELDLPSPPEEIVCMPLLENVRDRLSAMSQSFLQKALEVHRLDPAIVSAWYPSPAADSAPGLIILPPSATLSRLLREYMRIFEPFYGLIPGRVFNINTILEGSSNNTSTLFILLIVAQGAMSDPKEGARRLSGGLTEICRISLFDMLEKNVSSFHHHLLVHSSLLFIIQAAWSGDKWLMDIGLGQRGIYISVSFLFPMSFHNQTMN